MFESRKYDPFPELNGEAWWNAAEKHCTKIINGTTYKMSYYSYREVHDGFWVKENKEDAGNGIVCTCDNDTFTLDYGVYELIAKCSKCGKQCRVYGG